MLMKLDELIDIHEPILRKAQNRVNYYRKNCMSECLPKAIKDFQEEEALVTYLREFRAMRQAREIEGEWQLTGYQMTENGVEHICSVCNASSIAKTPYCSHCGSLMNIEEVRD